MPDFWAALIGAVIGTAGTLVASGIAYRAALKVEGDKSERNAVSDLMVAAYDFDAAILKLTETQEPDFMRADEDVRSSGRALDRLAYLVRDDKLRALALELEKVGFGERVNVKPSQSRADFQRVRKAREVLTSRANEVVKTLWTFGLSLGRHRSGL